LLKAAAAWQKVVMDGVLAPNGMISFAPYLKPEESEGIRAYLIQEARTLLKAESGKQRGYDEEKSMKVRTSTR
jgi:quinohemoprotein ethanol dehydrogenase